MPAFPEELGKVLEEAGVPPGAARLFLLAWHEGPLTARQIARRAGIHRVQAYRQLTYASSARSHIARLPPLSSSCRLRIHLSAPVAHDEVRDHRLRTD